MTDQHSVALEALRTNGFTPDENDAMRAELAAMRPAPAPGPDVRDLRSGARSTMRHPGISIRSSSSTSCQTVVHEFASVSPMSTCS
jgi:hypothetical protein